MHAQSQARRLAATLKDFHRALIKAELGDDPQLADPYSQLFALIGDPRFAWMGVLSGLIVRIEEFADDPDAGKEGIEGLRREAAALIGEEEDDRLAEFRLRRLLALQRDPDVGLATGRLRAELSRRP